MAFKGKQCSAYHLTIMINWILKISTFVLPAIVQADDYCNEYNDSSLNDKLCSACAAGTGGAACKDGSIISMCETKNTNICGDLESFCAPGGFSTLGYSYSFCCDSWIFDTCEVTFNSDLQCVPPYVAKDSICLACNTGAGGPSCNSESVQSLCQTDPGNVCSVLNSCQYGDGATSTDDACCDVWLSQSCNRVNLFSEYCGDVVPI